MVLLDTQGEALTWGSFTTTKPQAAKIADLAASSGTVEPNQTFGLSVEIECSPSGVRRRCLSDPEIIEQVRASAVEAAQKQKGFGLFAIGITDEAFLSSRHKRHEVCFGPHCQARYRQWLQARQAVVCLDLDTGKPIWTAPCAGARTLVVHGNTVFAANAHPQKATLTALDLPTGRQLWSREAGSLPNFLFFFAPLDVFVARGLVWGMAEGLEWNKRPGSGHTPASVPASLAAAWEVKLGTKLSSPVVAEGKVLAAAIDDYTLHAWDASHLAKSLLAGLDGDIRVSEDTIVVTYYNAPNVRRLREHYEHLPDRLRSRHIAPHIPWLYGFQLDFRFR